MNSTAIEVIDQIYNNNYRRMEPHTYCTQYRDQECNKNNCCLNSDKNEVIKLNLELVK